VAGSERHIRPGFWVTRDTDLDSRLAGYERRSRPDFRATHGAPFIWKAHFWLAGSERHIRALFFNRVAFLTTARFTLGGIKAS
jgi:hypothetical protein